VTILIAKLVLTPLLIVGATLAGRRWGHDVAGWIVGMPLTSGPVSLFVALQHGRHFAVHAAVGSLVAVIAEAVMFLVWGAFAERVVLGLAAGSLAFWAIALGLSRPWPIVPLTAVVVAALLVSQFLMRTLPERDEPARRPRWDLPARAIVATVLVLAITAVSGAVGPRVTGILGVYPLYSIVLATFAHHAAGAPAAVRVLRGVLLGLFAFPAFFVTIGLLLPHASIAVAYVAAVAAVGVVQLASSRALPKPPPPGVSMRTTSPAES
jgi:hypothetical protein